MEKMIRRFFCIMLLLAVLASGRIVRKTFNVANTQSGKVIEIMKRMNEGLNPPLMFQDFPNGLESAIAFLEHIDVLQSEESRLTIVCFSAELFCKSKAQNSR